ncbi:jg8340 [Pararge aegeria aegeria]|uniref:Jg8340 protein n=1 Tax=Pararge aegeria aegeria TaxID=348720 RepID=A0A8S4SIV1_9NEOP|nr:jg8340 [Pararge aegeria aegeria]
MPWTAFRTNVSILEELKVKERLSSTVQIQIFKFFGHITRNKHSMERLDVQGKVEGKWSRDHPALDRHNKCNAKDRNKWRPIAGAAEPKENVSS